ncbi:transposase [Bradyrhizobium japonicum]
MIPVASGVRVWIATGRTDMRRGMNSLGFLVQEAFKRDPHGGDLYVFRGKSGKLIKILWHDGLGMSLYAKRLERGRFLWPSSADGLVTITPAQLGYLLEGIDWRMPQHTWRRRLADRWDLNQWQDQRFEQRSRLVILWSAMGADDSLPDDVTTLQAMLRAERAARLAAEAEAQAGTLLIREAQAHDQEAPARAVRTVLRARRIAGPARATARRPGGERGAS